MARFQVQRDGACLYVEMCKKQGSYAFEHAHAHTRAHKQIMAKPSYYLSKQS